MINFNLTQAQAVLNSTGSYPLRNPFSTPWMNALDQVLSHMTDNDWDIRNSPPLERLTHALHMLEIWTEARPHYMKLVKQSRKKANWRKKLRNICPCLKKEITENGILDNMKSLAIKMRD